MTILCNDVDLLRREPGLLRECRPVASRLVLLATTFSGTDGTVTVGAFNGDTPVRAGQIAWVDARSRAFAVIGVGTQLIQLAAIHNAMPAEPTSESPELEAGPGDGNLTTEVWTFTQISAASRQVLMALGIGDLVTAGQFDREALREVTTLLALAAVFRSMSALDRTVVNDGLGRGTSFSEAWRALSQWYDKAAEREMRRVRLEVDANLDQRAEAVREPGSPRVWRT